MAIESALALLTAYRKSKEALVMLYAIGLQESRFKHQRQINVPALGFERLSVVAKQPAML